MQEPDKLAPVTSLLIGLLVGVGIGWIVKDFKEPPPFEWTYVGLAEQWCTGSGGNMVTNLVLRWRICYFDNEDGTQKGVMAYPLGVPLA